MQRTFVAVALVAVLSAPLVACDKPGEKEQTAEGRANVQAQQAQDEAARKAAEAQAEADRKVAAARIDFEKARDDYRSSRENDLADLNKRIAQLDAKEITATGQTKVDLDTKLPPIHSERDAFASHLKSLDATAAATWDTSKARLDQEWDALKANVDKL